MVCWNPEQYLVFARERARPFFDLVNAVVHPGPRAVVDLGCGPGGLTATLLERWPEARIWGVDSSREMIDHAARRAVCARLSFEEADISIWRAPAPLDIVISNACFHWVADHRALFDHLLPQIAAGGVLAFQVPDNFSEPSHTILQELLALPEWRGRVAGSSRSAVEAVSWYLHELSGRGCEVEAWQTTYHHVLTGDDAVLEWVRGTTLRQMLETLDDDDESEFLAAYGQRLDEVYPRHDFGTVFPFRRTFVVARRAAS